jgi:hypothetical protein
MTSQDQTTTEAPRLISQQELFKFLVQLADLYASPEYGNLPLAVALRELATTVKRKDSSKTRKVKPKSKELSLYQGRELKTLDHESIRAFLVDESKTKSELLDLASLRFSMPVSQLKRMKIAEVRQAINGALLHESSIEILSEEAGRDGANRKS